MLQAIENMKLKVEGHQVLGLKITVQPGSRMSVNKTGNKNVGLSGEGYSPSN